MLKVGIVGATGYAGMELVRLLSRHPETELVHLGSQSYDGVPYTQTVGSFRQFMDSVVCRNTAITDLQACDVLFLALPHGIASRQVTEELLTSCCIIDLGADYRLKDVASYEKWYGVDHGSPELLEKAVYGLPELSREGIKETNLIANPGCFTTCSILTLAPLIAEGLLPPGDGENRRPPIIIDAKSGVSGTGRKASQMLHFVETNESTKAYKIAQHRHTPEIEASLSGIKGKAVQVQFTPHLIPMNRGILVTAYLSPGRREGAELSTGALREIYLRYYKGEPFVRVLPEETFPETRWVKGSNFIDIGVAWDHRTKTIIALGAIDNLIKGAAGQAVQNMNIRFGFPEEQGLLEVPLFP